MATGVPQLEVTVPGVDVLSLDEWLAQGHHLAIDNDVISFLTTGARQVGIGIAEGKITGQVATTVAWWQG